MGGYFFRNGVLRGASPVSPGKGMMPNVHAGQIRHLLKVNMRSERRYDRRVPQGGRLELEAIGRSPVIFVWLVHGDPYLDGAERAACPLSMNSAASVA
jgi:hypothetical protein